MTCDSPHSFAVEQTETLHGHGGARPAPSPLHPLRQGQAPALRNRLLFPASEVTEPRVYEVEAGSSPARIRSLAAAHRER